MTVAVADLIERRKADLLARWRSKVTGRLTPDATRASELMNSLPVFIDEIVVGLRNGVHAREVQSPPGAGPAVGTARAHGAQRFHTGFSLETMVHEYEVLRECVLDVIEDEGIAFSMADLRALSRLLAQASADAAAQYTRERDVQVAEAAAEQFAFIAHELRNPLNAAVTATELLGIRLEDPRSLRLMATLQRSHARLVRLLDRVMLEHRLRAAGSDVHPHIANVALAELVADAQDIAAAEAEEKNVSIQLEANGLVDVAVDQRLFGSALGNLVLNAVKFTHEGGTVTVRASAREDRLVVEVEDECGGLPAGSLERLFVPHVQVGSNRSGFGLGLAIVKQAIEAHGGTIQARNLAPRGCVFMVDVPIRQPLAPHRSP